MSLEGEQLPVCMNHLVNTCIEIVLLTYTDVKRQEMKKNWSYGVAQLEQVEKKLIFKTNK